MTAQVASDPSVTVPVMVVDDRAEDRLALTTLLASDGYDVVAADSGKSALRRVLERDFAVLLLDVLMPGLDGFEVARTIKQRDRSRHTPIIFLTAANADIRSIYRAYSVGAVDFLNKPIDHDILRAKVAIFADLFRKDQQIQAQSRALREADQRQKQLEIADLRHRSERRYRNLAEAIPQIVWTARPDGVIDYCNRRWAEYAALPDPVAQGTNWLDALHPDDAEDCRRRWSEAVAAQAIFQAQGRLRRGSDGVYRWHVARALPEHDEQGRLVGWLGTLTDFEDLKQALDARDDFLSIAAHELRTPLTALVLNLQSLQRGLASGGNRASDPAEMVTKAVRQTARLTRLVDDLLDVSRVATGHLQLNPERFDLGELVRDITERFGEQAERAGCAIELQAGAHVEGSWDRLRLEQVVTNLLSNAIRYAPAKPVEVVVAQDDAGARIEVQDHGMGIPATKLSRIFDRFERAAPERAPGGLGMGLYIARRIVDAHGGAIHVDSLPGHGARFTVELPLDGPAAAGMQAAP